MATATHLTNHDRVRIALEAGRSIDTVRRVYQGRGNVYSRASIAKAAERLGLPLPFAPEQREAA